ncbi:hydrogenase nickel incorporation protein HypB [Wenjunlia tyrosinilytica]|uniref:Hydrogenase nickel incorporation protein HypB n=1 Tax=Wenjunlia tyrosinilytica TaxID=1544741 RepID=A0A917ZND4_9ACTN|nr:hydrogenase nickel incorporation protein HypB [Wenjunlia tyrosinilytica]GGO87948.1 hydrogenase nickel incorporation protein HypB [Wenjunlia tyrosinilytica]
MCRVVDLRQAVLAKNDERAVGLRGRLAEHGTVALNLMSSPGSGKTALLEVLLERALERGVTAAAVTADLATENDARRLAASGAPVKQVLTDGLCHLEAGMLSRHLDGWLPEGTRLLFVENVGNLVCPASYDLGETSRIVLGSVTEGEDKPLKYPSAFGLANLVVITKTDIAEAVEFDGPAFHRHVQQVNPGVPVLETSARTGAGMDGLLDLLLEAADGAPVHQPALAHQHQQHMHNHDEAAHDGDEEPHHPAAVPT